MNIMQKFHEFCKGCPLVEYETRTEKFYANGVVCETYGTVTCKHCDFCAQLKQAGIIK